MKQHLVELIDVSLIYHEPYAETMAIKDLSLTIDRGEFVAIVGPSGCGKTSMLSLLAGLIKPSRGQALLDGRQVSSTSDRIGYMLQRDHLLDWRTIEGNILLGLEVKHRCTAEARRKALNLMEKYGLADFRFHYPQQLSGGMRQKAALIRTLAFAPDLLLLDEPFSALDYQTRLTLADEVHSIIKQEGKTALLVTHDISEAISMSDRVLVFSQRPATIRSEHIIRLSREVPPLARRNLPGFKDYFDTIWKELDTHEES